jgi:hypothetical protein
VELDSRRERFFEERRLGIRCECLFSTCHECMECVPWIVPLSSIPPSFSTFAAAFSAAALRPMKRFFGCLDTAIVSPLRFGVEISAFARSCSIFLFWKKADQKKMLMNILITCIGIYNRRDLPSPALPPPLSSTKARGMSVLLCIRISSVYSYKHYCNLLNHVESCTFVQKSQSSNNFD